MLSNSGQSRTWLEIGIRLVGTNVQHGVRRRDPNDNLVDLERAWIRHTVNTLKAPLVTPASGFNMLQSKRTVFNSFSARKLHHLRLLESVRKGRLRVNKLRNSIIKARDQDELSAHGRVFLVQRFYGGSNFVNKQGLARYIHLSTSILKLEEDIARSDIGLSHINEGTSHYNNIGAVLANLIKSIKERFVVQTVAGSVRSGHGHNLERLAVLTGLIGRSVVVPHQGIDTGLSRRTSGTLADTLGDHLPTGGVETLYGNDLTGEERVGRSRRG
mmetsp:Transcript_23067/g.51207  ORF Transcript_23067/g.51207 Transcript_23067/m.51207 type:complete len:272 (+) Transcript_23067:523-1338(+)